MAGYFRKLVGHVYDGMHLASTDLYNGMFVELNSGAVRAASALKDTTLRVSDKTTLWGYKALVLDVVSVGTGEVWFTENEFEINDNVDYDERLYKIRTGYPVRMKRPVPGDQLIMTISDDLYNTVGVGDIVKPAPTGVVNKYPLAIIVKTQPAAETNVTAGEITGTLSCLAIDTALGAVTYKWKSNSSAATAGASDVAGATTKTLTIPTTLTADTYYYFCEITASDTATKANTGFAKVVVGAGN